MSRCKMTNNKQNFKLIGVRFVFDHHYVRHRKKQNTLTRQIADIKISNLQVHKLHKHTNKL